MNISLGAHVISALREGQPLVALETALLTHGLPHPLNVETALAMEDAVRSSGAVAATIGIIDGQVIVGMNEDELALLATASVPMKVGVRELPLAVAQLRSGGTTVAATAYISHRYGIKVFATGGIGGVHRGAQNTFDISGDLTVLGRTPITVVSSGAKAILDLKRTLEYLETAGITVVGYRTNTFPAFYCATSPFKVPHRLESAQDVAKTAIARDQLGLTSALLVSNPVPIQSQIPWEQLMSDIMKVDDEIKHEGIQGQDVTPQMLKRLFALTKGKTLQANLVLLKENARLGGEIATAIIAEKGEPSWSVC
jgi:pseudouridine-5'-phosphate glycosidase